MNLPNKLTTLRVVMIPLFLLALYQGYWMSAFILFGLASITDALDGHIARSRGLVTDFGKFMDPLADKLLVTSALISFVELLGVPGWVVFCVIARELAVTGLRTIAAGKGVVMAADKWGKLKTITQMVWLCYGLLMGFCISRMPLSGQTVSGLWLAFRAGMVLVLCTTLFSGWNYLWNNRGLFDQMK